MGQMQVQVQVQVQRMCHARGEMWGAPVSASGKFPGDSLNLRSPLLSDLPSVSLLHRTIAVCTLGLDQSDIIRALRLWPASWSITDRAYLAIAKCRTLHLCRSTAPPPFNA